MKVMAHKGQIIKVDLHQLLEVSYKHPDPNTFFSVYDYIRHSNISKSDSKILVSYQAKYNEMYKDKIDWFASRPAM